MDIGASIYRICNHLFPETFPLAPPKTTAQYEADANQACWQDIYSEPCARLSELAEQKGGINVRKELVDLEARVRPLLNGMLAEQPLEGGTCAHIVESSDMCEGNPNFASILSTPAGTSTSALGCYEVLQCTQVSDDPMASSLQIYVRPTSSGSDTL